MLLILISIIAAILSGVLLCWFVDRAYDNPFLIFFGVMLILIGGISALGYSFVAWNWFASEHKAKIINREYNTSYTAEEVYWASDVIDNIRELDRKRVEVNGDLFKSDSE